MSATIHDAVTAQGGGCARRRGTWHDGVATALPMPRKTPTNESKSMIG